MARARESARKYPRTARIDRLIQAVVAESLERNDDERLGLITVTGAHVDPDLRHAVVFYATRGNADDVEEALEEARITVQRDIAREVRMKRTPLLRFERDPAMDAGWRIEEILKQQREGAPEAGPTRSGGRVERDD
jgi:ribosome-binding factor A